MNPRSEYPGFHQLTQLTTVGQNLLHVANDFASPSQALDFLGWIARLHLPRHIAQQKLLRLVIITATVLCAAVALQFIRKKDQKHKNNYLPQNNRTRIARPAADFRTPVASRTAGDQILLGGNILQPARFETPVDRDPS